jgi:uncharacterized protein
VALGRMFGRDHVVHVAVAPGRLAERLTIEAARLGGLRLWDDEMPATGGKSGGDKTMDGASG